MHQGCISILISLSRNAFAHSLHLSMVWCIVFVSNFRCAFVTFNLVVSHLSVIVWCTFLYSIYLVGYIGFLYYMVHLFEFPILRCTRTFCELFANFIHNRRYTYTCQVPDTCQPLFLVLCTP